MLIVCLIIILVIIFVLYIYITIKLKKGYNIGEKASAIFTLGGFFGVLLYALLAQCDNKPQAIDVYRGNTELKITYIDTIPQDTLVIWKNN